MYTVYEEEEGLHLHSLILAQKRLSRKDLKLYKHGWSPKIVLLKTEVDVGVWTMYCAKRAQLDIEKKYEIQEYAEDYALENAPRISDKSNAGSDSQSDAMSPPILEDLTPCSLLRRAFDIRHVVDKL